MSEVLGNGSLERPNQEFIDPIDLLVRRYNELLGEKCSAEEELASVKSERAAAIRQATALFDPRIQDINARIRGITEQQDASISREVFERLLANSPSLYRVSLELLVDQYWGRGGIEGFIREIGAQYRLHSFNSVLAAVKAQLNGINSLETQLRGTEEPQPAIVYGAHRYEEMDEQAEWEGRDPGTGIFHTEVFGYKGTVTANSLMVETESFLLPDQFGYIERPAALVLRLSNAEVLHNPPSWTIKNYAREIAEDGSLTVRLISRKSKDSNRELLPIEWSANNVSTDKNLQVVVGDEQIQELGII